MCLFPRLNLKKNSIAYKKGVRTFNCGTCPECLAQKSRYWALKSYYEAKDSVACMVTLTYNNYIYDRKGNIIGETDPSQLRVDKKDCQKFFKRLRKQLDKKGIKIKYLITAEYGKRTHRPHYHAIIFGYDFPDRVPLKQSKRGNLIYRSAELNKIWKHGLTTVDCVNIKPSVIRYCTKYAIKDVGNNGTFMLFSHSIGVDNMLKYFTGKPYFIEGQTYPVPKIVWERYIENKYPNIDARTGEVLFSCKYKNRDTCVSDVEFFYFRDLRIKYRRVRDKDPVFREYMLYMCDLRKQKPYVPIVSRIKNLNNEKYNTYKIKAIELFKYRIYNYETVCPRATDTSCNDFYLSFAVTPPCHITANDTIYDKLQREILLPRFDVEELTGDDISFRRVIAACERDVAIEFEHIRLCFPNLFEKMFENEQIVLDI